jgi:hypothetical protein
MNLYQKLIEVRKACPYLKKDNTGYQFFYVSSSQTLGSLREAMDANGLLLIPRVISTEVRDHTTRKGDHEYFSIFNMTFTWVNADCPEETIECPWTGHGLDDGEKGVGKALTYAEKYFLLKFFNIATDKDDPDSFQKDQNKNGSDHKAADNGKADPEPPAGVKPSNPGQHEWLHTALTKQKIPKESHYITAELKLGIEPNTLKSFKELTYDQAKKLMDMLKEGAA